MLDGLSPVAFPHELKTKETYRDHCERAEVRVTVRTAAERKRLRANLWLDARKQGLHGRAVVADMPEFALEKGDR